MDEIWLLCLKKFPPFTGKTVIREGKIKLTRFDAKKK